VGGRKIGLERVNVRTKWRWMANFRPQLLYPWEENCHYLLNGELGVCQSWYGYFQGKNILTLPGIKLLTVNPKAWLLN
jgi:hypothetical protein